MRECASQRRTPSSPWVFGLHALVLPALVVASLLSCARAISYTVQVVAVSEQESALAVQRTLLNEAYPAYVVRASTVQGDIYRVRVGAFGNRDAALLFARTMPLVAGSPPLPALAEGIPAAVMPVEPRLLAQLTVPRLDVLPWGEGVALRVRQEADLQANYLVVSGERLWSFEAWQAEPVEGGVLMLRNLPLWPESWESDVPEAREAYRSATLESLATRFGLTLAALEELQGRPVFGPPYLVVLELVPDGGSGESTTLGIARPEGSTNRPAELVVGSGPLPDPPGPLYSAAPDTPPASRLLEGEGWRVEPAGSFFLLTTGDGGRGWRAGVGDPLWSNGSFLLTRLGERLLLYDFVSR